MAGFGDHSFHGTNSSTIYSLAMLFVAATALVSSGVMAASGKQHSDRHDLGPGCAPDRPAIAHHAGGIRVVLGRRADAPIPCSTNTGYRTSEIGMVVTNSGFIVGFQPALQTGFPIGALRSVDTA